MELVEFLFLSVEVGSEDFESACLLEEFVLKDVQFCAFCARIFFFAKSLFGGFHPFESLVVIGMSLFVIGFEFCDLAFQLLGLIFEFMDFFIHGCECRCLILLLFSTVGGCCAGLFSSCDDEIMGGNGATDHETITVRDIGGFADAFSVDGDTVRRAEIFNDVTIIDEFEFEMASGNLSKSDTNVVIRGATQADPFAFEFELEGFPSWR